MATRARLIVDLPAKNPDLYYASRFDAPDPCIFVEHRQRSYLLLSDLEFDRGKHAAAVDHVLSASHYAARARTRGGHGTPADIVTEFCREHRITALEVPPSTGIGLVEQLRARRLRVQQGPHPFYPQRLRKTTRDLRALRHAQRITFRAIALAEQILRASRVGPRHGLHWRGRPLTAERMKAEIMAFLTAQGFSAPDGLIIAGGNDATEPHNLGSGPLKAHTTIIVDIFPRSDATMMYGDATRTFCRGEIPAPLQRMYRAVYSAQRVALQMIRDGVNGRAVHRTVQASFERAGFPTGESRGRRHGFFHGTGHGLGLAIHEEPLRINAGAYTLRAGHVVTVEPGLYYHGRGGIRLEDVVLVTKTGCQLLSTYPKRFQV